MSVRPWLVAGWLGAWLAAVSCTSEEIVLGTVSGTGSEGSAATGPRCVTSADCGDNAFCDKHDCNAEAGNCAPSPLTCDDDEHPVCGCDGVTYYNDCLRRTAGVAASSPDECSGGTVRFCGGPGESCPSGAACARLTNFAGSCHGQMHGRCWVIPAHCPLDGRADRWQECSDVGVSGPLHCVDTCNAIRSGKTYARAQLCP
jgi:hypothetical protein